MGGWTTRVSVVGRPEPPPGEQDEAVFAPVDSDYFRTMRAPLRRGRHFTRADDARHPLVAIVNEAFVRRHFPGEGPLGRQIRIYGAPREIVGVAGDIRLASLTDPAPPAMYLPFRQNPIARFTLLLRGRADAAAVRRVVWSEDRDLALFDVGTLRAGLADTLAQRRVTTVLLASFAAVALLLAAAGIYGVVSYSVAQRTREIGIRIAVGARQADIVSKEIRGVMTQVVIGVAIGVAAALALGRALSTLVFDVSTADPPTFAAVSALLALTALAAAYLPARRASRVDPSVALRHE